VSFSKVEERDGMKDSLARIVNDFFYNSTNVSAALYIVECVETGRCGT